MSTTETRTVAVAAKYGHQGQWLTPGCGYRLQKPLADFLVEHGFASDSDDPDPVDMTHLALAENTTRYVGGALTPASVKGSTGAAGA